LFVIIKISLKIANKGDEMKNQAAQLRSHLVNLVMAPSGRAIAEVRP